MYICHLKHYRILSNLSQEDLAKLIDVSVKTIHNIEVSRNIPSIIIALKIAKVLNVDIEDLFTL